jgi:ABC-type nickel/cobalt efflux system permease component RcnA
MPKALCLISLVASILIVVLFLADLAMGMLGMDEIAPLRAASTLMDITFVVLGGVMIYLSWATYREQR